MDRKQIFEVARNVPMGEVMEFLGAGLTYKSKTGKDDVYLTPDAQEVIVEEYGWIVRGSGNGCGAIDLIMLLTGCDKCGAVNYLRPLTGAPFDLMTTRPVLLFNKTTRKTANVPSATPATFPLPDPSRWNLARDYLVIKRGLAVELVDELHEDGLVYASPSGCGRFTNCIFVGTLCNAGDAVEIRGVVGKFKSRFGIGAWFSIGAVDETKPIAVAESAIEAMSLRCLGYRGMIVSSGGSFSANSHLVGHLRDLGKPIIAAMNNDGEDDDRKAGRLARNLESALGATRLKPLMKDWNDCLRSGLIFTNSI